MITHLDFYVVSEGHQNGTYFMHGCSQGLLNRFFWSSADPCQTRKEVHHVRPGYNQYIYNESVGGFPHSKDNLLRLHENEVCPHLHFCGRMRWVMSANLHKAALRLLELPFFLISLYNSTCSLPRLVSINVCV